VLGFDAIADNISPVQVVERIVAMVPAPTPVWNEQQRAQAREEHRYAPQHEAN
jgi:MoxR-like ATPase